MTIYKQIWQEIKKAKNILLILHPGPDADSIGSNLALYHVLTKMGKKVTLLGGDSDLPKDFSCLPGFDQILSKNFFQIDPKQFDLFLILDASSLSQISKQGEVVFPQSLKTIIIDHHQTSTKFADLNLIDNKASATCQILFDLLEDLKVKITPDIAICLFIGIYTDTGGFKYSLTTSKTFSIVTKLTEINPNFPSVIFNIENNNEPDRLKFLSLMLGSVKTYLSDHVAIASISFKEIQKNNIKSTTIYNSEIPNLLKSVVGWDIGISLIEYQPNTVKVSLRTRNAQKYNLGFIAQSLGSGGGHQSAAGATIAKSLPEAKKIVLDIIQKLYPKIDKI